MKFKQLLLSALVFTFLTHTEAQTEAGNYFLGLNSAFNARHISVNYENFNIDDDPKQFQLRLAPRIGYFIVENFVIGAGVELSYLSSKPNDSQTTVQNGTFGSVFARYYIPNDVVRPFIEVSGGLGQFKTETDLASGNSEDFTENGINYSIAGGMAIPIGKKVSFDAMLAYRRLIQQPQTNPNDLKTKFGIVDFSVGFSIYLGNGKITKV